MKFDLPYSRERCRAEAAWCMRIFTFYRYAKFDQRMWNTLFDLFTHD